MPSTVRDTEPFRSIITGERFASANFSINESLQIYVVTSTNLTSVSVVKLPQILVVDDGQEKAKEIVQNIGKRPIFAYGNSNGDIPMLQFTTSDGKHGMGLLNHHDDPVSEYAYDKGSAIGRLDSGLEMAEEWGWHVVSMKEDWKEIF